MTKEEFLAGVQDSVEDFSNGGMDDFLAESQELINDLRTYDPVMSYKVNAIVVAIQEFGKYVLSRAER